MNLVPSSPDDLSSWKEIAAYLGVSVKTAQLWERDRGLPVHRLPGGRSGVWAVEAEIIAWKRQQYEPAPLPPKRRRWPVWLASGLAVLTVLILGWIWPRDRMPHGLLTDEHGLTAIDREGEKLWRYATPAQSGVEWVKEGEERHLATVVDLDGDERPEVLYAPALNSEPDRRVLRCLDHRGRERWRFEANRTVLTADEKFAPPYIVTSLLVLPADAQGHRRLVVLSAHNRYYPAQVALLNHEGKLLREYWHAGHLHHATLHAWRGRTLVLVAGINNAARQGVLLALDPETMEGAGAESVSGYQLLDLPPGNELARLLFPRSCVNRSGEPFNRVQSVTADGNDLVASVVESEPNASLNYKLTNALEFQSVDATSIFVARHEQFRQQGQVDHDLTQEEISTLRPVTVKALR